jgi:hypothetical protein
MTDISVNESTPVNLSQFAGAALPYVIDVGSVAISPWTANASIAANAVVRPSNGNESGFAYQSSAAGQTGPIEPAWAKTGTVSDGSLTWTPLVPPVAGEDSISSVTWTQQNPPDATLTISSQSNTALTATAKIGGGTYGNVYTIIVKLTMASSAIYPVEINLAIV